MFPLPERFTVTHEARLEGVEDSQGNPVEGWAAPVVVPVYGWGPPSPDAETRPEMTGVRRDLDVYCRTGFAGPRDRVTVDGTRFEVVGYPEDFNHGPFGFTPGFRVSLKRMEG